MATGKPATIYDVAARANLSIATVSRVLQGTGPVSEKARVKVGQAAAELNYVPLRAARSLAVQRHEAHGLVLPDLSGPFYGDLLMGYERWAGEHGQSVVLTVTQGNADPRRSVRDLAGRVDGIVVHGNALDLPTIQELRKAGVALVLVAHPPVTGCDSVRTESASSSERLTTRLLDTGRKNLVFVGDPISSYDVSERYAGFAKAHESRGSAVPEPLCVPLTEESGKRVAKEILATGNRPGGLVCANDELALAALTTLRAGGIAVPEDVVVTGWDDVMAARYVSPGLTTVRQPMAELGQLAAQRLHERVTGERTRARNDVLATEIVLRDSCGTSGAMQQ
ncbi:LacI family transcriptional regulator [Kribbella antibiotica]|uniref:LacI family transcriptional regulator n=1 Tax=Kribbella antibiotica TaxID=190195 RepID=A0A4R4ZK37_9ACTN|nr:LacI family DNA-binding transcriptional regulator [Kribbella antibiotica]TDD59128.1 LacI family transcriptional regulator [Kribbella antibiotica]